MDSSQPSTTSATPSLTASPTTTPTASVPLPEILAIAIGAPVLFAVLVTIVICHLRRKHRKAKNGERGVESGNVRNNMRGRNARMSMLRSMPRPIANPFLPEIKPSTSMSSEWLVDDSMMDAPPMSTTRKKSLSHRSMIKMTKIKESWPRPTYSPSTSTVTVNQVAPPGYLITQEPARPSRAYSKRRLSTSKISLPADQMRKGAPSTSESRPLQHRSASESHLSTILRSTSQRLRSTRRNNQKQNLARAKTSFAKSPGPPPKDRLKTPSKQMSESREALMLECSPESVGSSVYGTPYTSTPSQKKRSKTSNQIFSGSPSPRGSSGPDSLISDARSQEVHPPSLTPSESKSKASPRPPAMRVPTENANDLSALVKKDSKAQMLALGEQGSNEEKAAFTSPHRIVNSNDPFCSSVTVHNAKTKVAKSDRRGPRPLYIRKATFGQEATSKRPESFESNASPLRNISGNVQPPGQLDGSEENADSSQSQSSSDKKTTRSNQQSNASWRRGHKRSSLMHLSGNSRASTVPPIPEMKISPVELISPVDRTYRAFEPVKQESPSPSPSPTGRLTIQPPSNATFSPTPPALIAGVRPKSRTAEMVSSPSSFYINDRPRSGEDLLRKQSNAGDKHLMGWVTHPEHHELFSSPSLGFGNAATRHIRSNSMTSSVFSVTGSRQFSFLPIPRPVEPESPTPSSRGSMIIPGHLTGPRSDPARPASKSFSISSPKETLHQSIFMLRRMNSDISRVSTEEDLESLRTSSTRSSPHRRSQSFNLERLRDRKEARGSKAYLSMGAEEVRKSRIEKRHSKARQFPTVREMSEEVDGVESSSHQVDEHVFSHSRATPSDDHPRENKRSQPLPSNLRARGSPVRVKSVRWSDALPKPSPPRGRRESRLLDVNAMAAFRPHRTLSPEKRDGAGADSMRIRRVDNVLDYGNWNGNHGSPDSLGLYDTEGFLRMSPKKEIDNPMMF